MIKKGKHIFKSFQKRQSSEDKCRIQETPKQVSDELVPTFYQQIGTFHLFRWLSFAPEDLKKKILSETGRGWKKLSEIIFAELDKIDNNLGFYTYKEIYILQEATGDLFSTGMPKKRVYTNFTICGSDDNKESFVEIDLLGDNPGDETNPRFLFTMTLEKCEIFYRNETVYLWGGDNDDEEDKDTSKKETNRIGPVELTKTSINTSVNIVNSSVNIIQYVIEFIDKTFINTESFGNPL